MSCVLCLEVVKVFEPKHSVSPPQACCCDAGCKGGVHVGSSVMMLQALEYVHGIHELLFQSLCGALDNVAPDKMPKKHDMERQFLCMAPSELRDIIYKLSDPTTKLLRQTNRLKRFVAAATREATVNKLMLLSAHKKYELPKLLPGASVSDRVSSVLLFVWGHHCQGLDDKQLKQWASTLGVPARRLKLAQQWHALVCQYPGILCLTLRGHATSALWENARDLGLLLQSLTKDDTYKDKVLALSSDRHHFCFECMTKDKISGASV